MFIKKLATYAFTLTTLITCRVAEAQPTLFPSTLCVHTNESVFIIGTGLKPGEQIQGFLLSSHYRYPLWVLYADTNGNLSADITVRGNLNMQGPRAVQEYQFSGASTNATFHLWYQTYNPSNDWHATDVRFETRPFGDTSTKIYVLATVVPYNNYQLEVSTNVSGPWSGIGYITKSETSFSSITLGTGEATPGQQFFRVGNPYLPCPCDF